MLKYDHRVHAGNAGDVWKHFLLLEAADWQLVPHKHLFYLESHVGRPDYVLSAPGEWQCGIGKCWPFLPSLRRFCYFDILADQNPEGLKNYPGSAWLVREVARRKGSILHAEVWDIDAEVATTWSGSSEIAFHLGDGFSGVSSVLDHMPPGLLLIDPPNFDPVEAKAAKALQSIAVELGWTVVWWYMIENEPPFLNRSEKYALQFSRIGFDCGRDRGCAVSLSSSDESLKEHLLGSIRDFLKIMDPAKPFSLKESIY